MSEDGHSPWIIRWRFKYPATPDMTFVCFAECREVSVCIGECHAWKDGEDPGGMAVYYQV